METKTIINDEYKIIKSFIWIMISEGISMLAVLAVKIIIVRSLTPKEFGVYSILLTIINFGILFSILGMQTGLTQRLSVFIKKRDTNTQNLLILSSFLILFLTNIIFILIIFYYSKNLSLLFFQDISYGNMLKIAVITTPFAGFIQIIVAVSRAHKQYLPKIMSLLLSSILYILISGFIYLKYPFLTNYLIAYLFSFLLSSLYFLYILFKKYKFNIPSGKYSINKKIISLFSFSMPLFISQFVVWIIFNIDNFLISYYLFIEKVGIYAACFSLAIIIGTLINATNFLYLPIFTAMKVRDKNKTDVILYKFITKFNVFLALPISMIFILFSKEILLKLFGENYVSGEIALKFLTIGAILNVAFGPNGMTLVALGRNIKYLFCSIIAIITNISLNIILIPQLGIKGAAIASLFAFVVLNILRSLFVYIENKNIPFSGGYLISTSLFIVFTVVLSNFLKDIFINFNIIYIILYLEILYIIYFLIYKATNSLTQEDKKVILLIKQKIYNK